MAWTVRWLVVATAVLVLACASTVDATGKEESVKRPVVGRNVPPRLLSELKQMDARLAEMIRLAKNGGLTLEQLRERIRLLELQKHGLINRHFGGQQVFGVRQSVVIDLVTAMDLWLIHAKVKSGDRDVALDSLRKAKSAKEALERALEEKPALVPQGLPEDLVQLNRALRGVIDAVQEGLSGNQLDDLIEGIENQKHSLVHEHFGPEHVFGVKLDDVILDLSRVDAFLHLARTVAENPAGAASTLEAAKHWKEQLEGLLVKASRQDTGCRTPRIDAPRTAHALGPRGAVRFPMALRCGSRAVAAANIHVISDRNRNYRDVGSAGTVGGRITVTRYSGRAQRLILVFRGSARMKPAAHIIRLVRASG